MEAKLKQLTELIASPNVTAETKEQARAYAEQLRATLAAFEKSPLPNTKTLDTLDTYYAIDRQYGGYQINDAFGPYVDYAYRSGGAGGFLNQIQTFLTCLDRFQRNVLPAHSEHSGFTFITRPKLCLASANLRMHRPMLPLDTMDVNSMAFMIRCLLDTRFCEDWLSDVIKSPLIDPRNPFLTPLCNGVTSITGFPDFVLETETTQGGFHSEDQTYAIGSAIFNKTQELSIGFKDIQYAPISAILQYWCEYIHCVTDGRMIAYPEDIDAQRMNYTVSIYRFNVDPTRRYITHFAKATGCFPKSHPVGGMVNVNEGEIFVQTAGRFTTNFVANKVEYADHAIWLDFNILMERYCPGIHNAPDYDMEASNNFLGLPFIKIGRSGAELVFKNVDALLTREQLAASGTSVAAYPSGWRTTIEYLTNVYKQQRQALDDALIYAPEVFAPIQTNKYGVPLNQVTKDVN